MVIEQIAVYGGGGFAREVAWLAEACGTDALRYDVVCFIEDDVTRQGRTVNDIPVMSLEDARSRFPIARVVAGVGGPRVRERLMDKAAAAGFGFASLIHPRTERSRFVEVDIGAVVCAGNILTTNIQLGRHVQVNLDCTIGHDAILGDYTTLAPGVHISGWVHTGRRVYFGTGAVVVNGTEDAPLEIGDDAVIGAGACVTKSVPAGVTVVGVPARPLQRARAI